MTAQPFKTLALNLLRQGHHDEETFLQGLDEAERSAIGTPSLWSVKDHVAHRVFWHQEFVQKLNAILQHQELPPNEDDDDQINSIVFEKHKLRPWSDIYADSERVYAELIKLVEQLSEEDLTTSKRFSSISGETPLYTAFLGSCYEHDQEHFAQYYSDRNDILRATEIREKCASRIIEAEVPEWVKGWFLYNLACFYAQQSQIEKATATLQEALTLDPGIKEHSLNDPDLAALRD